jgi:hypothetical protein
MPAFTADIVSATGSAFTFTTTAGTVTSAFFQGSSTGVVTVDTQSNNISVSNLPAGDSTLLLTIIWAPGEPNGRIQIVSSQHPITRITTAEILDDGVVTGVVELFGE